MEADLDEIERWLERRLHRYLEQQQRLELRQAELAGMLDELLDLLVARGTLAPGHRRHLARAATTARRAREADAPRYRLHLVGDKYALAGAAIDCAERLPLCRARCCAFTFALSPQDLDEGVVRFEIDAPYRIRHERDGYCTHLDRATSGCTIHAQRPAPCRVYDCREDPRVWIDFERRLPAPMPAGLGTLDPDPASEAMERPGPDEPDAGD